MNIIFLTFLIGAASAASYPKDWTRCKVSPSLDNKRNKCIEKATESIVKYLSIDGDKELGLKDLDPLRIKRIVVGQTNPGSPVNMRADFIDSDVYGFADLKVTFVDGKFSSPKNWTFHMKGDMKRVDMKGTYSVSGNMLIFPIVGNGNSSITLLDANAEGYIYGDSQIKNGKEYLKITGNKFELNAKKGIVKLDNLFNGDKALSDNMNRILNENWDILFEELKPSIAFDIGKHLTKYAKNILEKIPYEEMVLKDE